MARIRSIKPEFWTDTAMVGLSVYARLFYVGLWNFADDYGCVEDEPTRLKLQILPADDVDPAALVDELVASGRVERWTTAEGKAILWIPRFGDHQKIDKRSPSRFGDRESWTRPPVPAEVPRIPPTSAECQPIPPDPPLGREGNGRESLPPNDQESNSGGFTGPDEGRKDHQSKHFGQANDLVAMADQQRWPHFTDTEKRDMRVRAMECLAAGWPPDLIVAAARDAAAATPGAFSFAARKATPADKLDGIRAFLADLPDEPDRLEIA